MGVACDRHGRQRCAAVARRQRCAAVTRNEAGGRGDDEREKQPPHGGDRRTRAEVAVCACYVGEIAHAYGMLSRRRINAALHILRYFESNSKMTGRRRPLGCRLECFGSLVPLLWTGVPTTSTPVDRQDPLPILRCPGKASCCARVFPDHLITYLLTYYLRIYKKRRGKTVRVRVVLYADRRVTNTLRLFRKLACDTQCAS